MSDGDRRRQIELIDDENNTYRFRLEEVVEVSGRRYAILLPEEDPEAGVVVCRVEKQDGEEVLVSVDDAEAEAVLETMR